MEGGGRGRREREEGEGGGREGEEEGGGRERKEGGRGRREREKGKGGGRREKEEGEGGGREEAVRDLESVFSLWCLQIKTQQFLFTQHHQCLPSLSRLIYTREQGIYIYTCLTIRSVPGPRAVRSLASSGSLIFQQVQPRHKALYSLHVCTNL